MRFSAAHQNYRIDDWIQASKHGWAAEKAASLPSRPSRRRTARLFPSRTAKMANEIVSRWSFPPATAAAWRETAGWSLRQHHGRPQSTTRPSQRPPGAWQRQRSIVVRTDGEANPWSPMWTGRPGLPTEILLLSLSKTEQWYSAPISWSACCRPGSGSTWPGCGVKTQHELQSGTVGGGLARQPWRSRDPIGREKGSSAASGSAGCPVQCRRPGIRGTGRLEPNSFGVPAA